MSTETNLGEPARQPTADPGTSFDVTPTDEQKMLIDAVRDFALRACRPAALSADDACATPAGLLATATELGLGALGIPEAHGGVMEQRSTVTAALVAEALAEGDMGIALACLAPGAVATALGLWGDAGQQAAYLPAFGGEAPPAAAIAVAEPRVLFDPLMLATRAARTASGDFVLDGVKALVPRGAEAEVLLVAADLDGAPALFIVEAGSAGVSTGADPAMGLRAAATARVTLEHVQLPAGALLGDSDPQVYRELLALGRIGWSALAAGTCRAVLDYVSGYVNQRIAFGEPISNRQSVAFMVANIAIELESLRLATYRAAGLAETGREFSREAALARALVARHAMQIGSDGVQLLGGHGYTKEHPVERWYRDLRAAGILEGALIV
ncbi:MAG TPA: acyl-CoA dehydrogenase family protein [Solirubrobacteraceae bacterium]|nr:acyl-CoA dehydrogenase family protein [Solirubrobacteraceae bacterium]